MAQILGLPQPTFLFACQAEVNGDVFFFSLPQPQDLVENAPPIAANEVMHLPLNALDGSNVIFNYINEFVCFIYKRHVNAQTEYVQVICTPSIGQSSTLPRMNTNRVRMMSYYGYDEVHNQLKVLSMTWINGNNFEEHQVLTFGNGNELWRPIKCSIPHYSSRKGICINGFLYYPATNLLTEESMIVRFDVGNEVFSSIPIIMEPVIEAMTYGPLIDYNGNLGIIQTQNILGVDNASTGFTLWTLNVGTLEWAPHVYEFPALLENTVGEAMLSFKGMTLRNELVASSFYPSNPFYLFYYNIVTNNFRKVQIEGMDAYEYRCTFLN